jgi:hypothetical protein
MSTETPIEPATAPRKLLRQPRPNHQVVLRAYRAMTPEQKLQEVFKLNELGLELMRAGLRARHPDLDEAALQRAYLRMRARCHSKSY